MAGYSNRFDEAVALAVDSFRGRVRKGTAIPYVSHLFAVTTTVAEHGGDEEQMIAAVLHDWLEDIKGADPALLEARFGARVRRLVEALTDATTHPKPPWRPRKEAYVAHLRGEPPELKLISAADKLHNAQSILRDHALVGEAIWGRFSASKEDTLWYYRSVTEALAEGWSHALVGTLAEAVRAMHRAGGESLPLHWEGDGIPGEPLPENPGGIEVILCKTGLRRHGPDLPRRLAAVGARVGTVDCFDRCEVCELAVIARIDGATARFRLAQELVDAVETLRA